MHICLKIYKSLNNMNNNTNIDTDSNDINVNLENNKEICNYVEQLKYEKKYKECLQIIEKLLLIKLNKFGKNSDEFVNTALKLCEICNLLALSLLESNRGNEGLIYLEKAEKTFHKFKEILVVCLNNLGCYYNSLNNTTKSLGYLDKALTICLEIKNKRVTAEIYLNLSTILNKLGEYNKAKDFCLNSIATFQEIIINDYELSFNDINCKPYYTNSLVNNKISSKQNKNNTNELYTNISNQIKDDDYIKKSKEEELFMLLNLLSIAYKNLGVQFDNLNDLNTALLYYEISYTIFNKIKLFPCYLNNYTIFSNIDSFSNNLSIDYTYKAELLRKLENKEFDNKSSKTNNLKDKTFYKIGKQGHNYYNEFLNSIKCVLNELSENLKNINIKNTTIKNCSNRITDIKEENTDNNSNINDLSKIKNINEYNEDSVFTQENQNIDDLKEV